MLIQLSNIFPVLFNVQFLKTKQLQTLRHLFCQIRMPAATQQIASSLLSKRLMKNLGCPVWNCANGTPWFLFSSCVEKKGCGRAHCIKSSLQNWNISSVSWDRHQWYFHFYAAKLTLLFTYCVGGLADISQWNWGKGVIELRLRELGGSNRSTWDTGTWAAEAHGTQGLGQLVWECGKHISLVKGYSLELLAWA